jgi:capsular polysaccharide biosynthesis protein
MLVNRGNILPTIFNESLPLILIIPIPEFDIPVAGAAIVSFIIIRPPYKQNYAPLPINFHDSGA